MENIGLRFAQHLKKLRAKYRLTQEELADRAGISVKHVQRLESKDPCGVRLVTLARIAKAFSISLSNLFRF